MSQHSLYGGKVILDFNEKRHLYTISGRPIRSVTGISEPKPALLYWAAKMASEHILANLKPGVALDEIEIASLAEGAKKAHSGIAGKAADIGTLAHAACEGFVKSGGVDHTPVNIQARASYLQFVEWYKTHKVEIHASEAKVYHLDHDYCGTLDLDATVDGIRCIVDVKTSNAVYLGMHCQVAAYTKARGRELGVEYGPGWILRLPKDGAGFEAKKIDDIEQAFGAFLGLKEWYDYEGRNK